VPDKSPTENAVAAAVGAVVVAVVVVNAPNANAIADAAASKPAHVFLIPFIKLIVPFVWSAGGSDALSLCLLSPCSLQLQRRWGNKRFLRENLIR
jgi:hypothetical protein